MKPTLAAGPDAASASSLLRAHVPEPPAPPEHDPNLPPGRDPHRPEQPPPDRPDQDIDLPPREAPEDIRDPRPSPDKQPPLRSEGIWLP